jgi:phage FluMu gp28-like protein
MGVENFGVLGVDVNKERRGDALTFNVQESVASRVIVTLILGDLRYFMGEMFRIFLETRVKCFFGVDVDVKDFL